MSNKNIITLGINGNWGKGTVGPALTKRAFNVTETGEVTPENLQRLMGESDFDYLFMLTPPQTRKELLLAAAKAAKGKPIFAEKPCPDLHSYNDALSDPENIFIIDHYLAKSGAQGAIEKAFSRSKYFSGFLKVFGDVPLIKHAATVLRTPLKRIEIDIIEVKEEKRPWMTSREKNGGVVLDLAHHALAILVKIFGVDKLAALKPDDITILSQKDFSSAPDVTPAEKMTKILFHIDDVAIIVHVEKQNEELIEDRKQIRLFHSYIYDSQPDRCFDLSSQVEYENINDAFDQKKPRLILNIKEASAVAKLIESTQKNLYKQPRTKELRGKIDAKDQVEVLADQFKHRHTFFWAQYFKIMTLQTAIIIAPIIAYGYLMAPKITTPINDGMKMDMAGADNITTLGLLVISVAISAYSVFVQTRSTEIWLAEEHHRMKQCHDEMKSILTGSGVNLNTVKINKFDLASSMLELYRYWIRLVGMTIIITASYLLWSTSLFRIFQ